VGNPATEAHEADQGARSLTTESDPPADGVWGLTEGGGCFTQLVGPIYTTQAGLEGDEPVRFGFRVRPQHCNPRMVCHGGMLATFLDVALAGTLLKLPGVSSPLLTINMTLDYLAPAPCGDWIESRVTVPKLGASIGFTQTLLVGPRGPVLRGSGVYKRGRHVK
jgi:uncharacterized protein (TIGR00369 family)